MSATITKELKLDKAKNNIVDLDDDYYFFSGRCIPWDDETNPDQVDTSQNSIIDAKKQMLALKRVSKYDAMLVVPRFTWTTGDVFEKYKSSRTVTDVYELIRQSVSTYCVIGDNVYICLDNNNGGDSTISPSGTSSAPITLSDGYKWQFLYNISSVAQSPYTQSPNDFHTPYWIPVPHLELQKTAEHKSAEASAVPGTLNSITIVDGGSGYSDGSISVVITGDGTGATTGTPVIVDGIITSIPVVLPGTGYTYININVIGGSTSAEVQGELSPVNGNTYRAESMLHAFYVMLSGNFSADESGTFQEDNSYRQVGLIKSPTDTSDVVLSGDNYNCCTVVNISNISSPLSESEVVTSTGEGTTGYVFSAPSAPGDLHIIDVSGDISETDNTITGQTSGEIVTVVSVTEPEYKAHSGDIMYLENIRPVTRATAQTEYFKFVIEY